MNVINPNFLDIVNPLSITKSNVSNYFPISFSIRAWLLSSCRSLKCTMVKCTRGRRSTICTKLAIISLFGKNFSIKSAMSYPNLPQLFYVYISFIFQKCRGSMMTAQIPIVHCSHHNFHHHPNHHLYHHFNCPLHYQPQNKPFYRPNPHLLHKNPLPFTKVSSFIWFRDF